MGKLLKKFRSSSNRVTGKKGFFMILVGKSHDATKKVKSKSWYFILT
jgi:hypothetical protein